MSKENIISYYFMQNCTRIVITHSVALLKRKNLSVKYFSYKMKLKLTLLRKCQSVPSFQEDLFLHYCLCDVLTFPGREESALPRRVNQTLSVAQRPLLPRACSRESAAAQS